VAEQFVYLPFESFDSCALLSMHLPPVEHIDLIFAIPASICAINEGTAQVPTQL
jgi:hypothetical protein